MGSRGLPMAFVVQVLFVGEFGWDHGSGSAAFLQNLLMSGLFTAMVVGRRGTRGQTRVIAVGKWIGTLAPTIAFGVRSSRPSWRSQSRSAGDMTSAPAVGAGADAMDAWSGTRLRTRAPPCCAAPAS